MLSSTKLLFLRSLLLSGIGAIVLWTVNHSTLNAQTPDAASAPAELAPAPEPSAAPEPTISAPEVAPAPSNESYIDSTDYGVGATQRSLDLPAPAVEFGSREPLPSAPSVSVGAIGAIDPSSYGVAAIGSTPSLKDFYRRTLRPPGQLGNGNIRLIFPLSIPAPITSLFGWRVHPIFGTPRFHSGTDIGAPIGTPVVAAYAGQVALADFLGGYGLAVALSHNWGKQQTLYGHLSEVFVKSGDLVKQGAVIGRVGSTGNSTGPHLHFEYREHTSEGWVALDAGAQLEYALAELVKVVEVSQNGIASATNIGTQRGQAGISGQIAWNAKGQIGKPAQ